MPVPAHREAFGSRLRLLRAARVWSQEELAYAPGLDRSYAGGVERGQRNVSLDNIHKLAKASSLRDVHRPRHETSSFWPFQRLGIEFRRFYFRMFSAHEDLSSQNSCDQ